MSFDETKTPIRSDLWSSSSFNENKIRWYVCRLSGTPPTDRLYVHPPTPRDNEGNVKYHRVTLKSGSPVSWYLISPGTKKYRDLCNFGSLLKKVSFSVSRVRITSLRYWTVGTVPSRPRYGQQTWRPRTSEGKHRWTLKITLPNRYYKVFYWVMGR